MNAMAQQLNDFWQPRTHCPRLTALISCLLMHPLRPLPPILWFHPWVLGFLHQVQLVVQTMPVRPWEGGQEAEAAPEVWAWAVRKDRGVLLEGKKLLYFLRKLKCGMLGGALQDILSSLPLTVFHFFKQACHLLAPSHLQCHLLEPSLLGYPQPCLHHLCHLGLEDMAPQQQELQGLDILVMAIYILTPSHQVGCPIQGCLRRSWLTMAPMA